MAREAVATPRALELGLTMGSKERRPGGEGGRCEGFRMCEDRGRLEEVWRLESPSRLDAEGRYEDGVRASGSDDEAGIARASLAVPVEAGAALLLLFRSCSC